MQRKGSKPAEDALKKKFPKPLDKPHGMWYNKDVPKRERQERKR
jgi:hypothetical protein